MGGPEPGAGWSVQALIWPPAGPPGIRSGLGLGVKNEREGEPVCAGPVDLQRRRSCGPGALGSLALGAKAAVPRSK